MIGLGQESSHAKALRRKGVFESDDSAAVAGAVEFHFFVSFILRAFAPLREVKPDNLTHKPYKSQ